MPYRQIKHHKGDKDLWVRIFIPLENHVCMSTSGMNFVQKIICVKSCKIKIIILKNKHNVLKLITSFNEIRK